METMRLLQDANTKAVTDDALIKHALKAARVCASDVRVWPTVSKRLFDSGFKVHVLRVFLYGLSYARKKLLGWDSVIERYIAMIPEGEPEYVWMFGINFCNKRAN